MADDTHLERAPGGDADRPDGAGDLTRRDFIGAVGAGATGGLPIGGCGSARPAPEPPLAPAPAPAGDARVLVTLAVNGARHRLRVEPRWTLLFVLRERLGLTGAKEGCHRGECGACTVLFGDTPRYACLTLAVEAQGVALTTVEGLLDGEELGPVQQAFVAEDAYQCGYCTPGQVLAVEGLLRANPAPARDEIRVGVSGNLCRCGAYNHIFAAAERAARARRGGAGGA